MRKIGLLVFLSITLFMPGLANAMAKQQPTNAESADAMVKAYVCPMDQYTSGEKGDCQMCGMKLEEKEMTAAALQDAMDKSKEMMRFRT